MDVIEIMSPLIKDIGSELRVDHLPERVFDVRTNVLDSKKLGDHTGWKPQIEFREGLLLTRDWLRQYKDE